MRRSFRANGTEENKISRTNPLIFIFHFTDDTYSHCMSYFSVKRVIDQYKGIKSIRVMDLLTNDVYAIDKGTGMTMYNTCRKIAEDWRDNYFNPDWKLSVFEKK
jgi:hypothetical protein